MLAAKNCKGFAKSKRGGLSFGLTGTSGGVPGAFSFGGDKMEKSPLGDATRDAITGCMLFIIEELNKVPWSGRVMKVENGQVYINCGTRNNINIGDQFKIFKLGEAFTDPDTGESLGSEESEIGSIRVVKTQEKFSICSAVSGQAEQFAKDNVIRWNG
ncbi:MAG: hypothetical protein ACD_79C00265G0001 [uncultured bacterium]|nr:MAG: hypothetical protein ACD_79C00265G0001 [uncultured bacterium]